ncbi:putative protein kinase [Plasmodium gaboni]|uniref:Protein kinase domain-containing protein n=1 Tax=Plasmodium gaboni TaxID=647221 RepID=A0A151LNN0_9APIC|nr:putative protein kinase [Plasmodium gaboni]KYO00821.1 putative protein kinase [Plasmodium gaboni]
MGNTLYSNIGHSTTELDDVYCKYLNKLFNIYNYLFKYEHFIFMNSYTLNNFYHVLEGINNNEGHVLIKICKLKSEAPKIKRILYTLKFLFSFDLFPNVLPYNRMSVYENNIYIYRRFIFKNLDHYLSDKTNTNNFYYFYIFQIFLSIIQLHSLGIYHGHIKRENVLIQNNMHIFLTDINILNDYLYYIPQIRYEDERKGRLMKLQEDIFNLGILILEILLRDKDVSYFFLDENCAYKNDDNFYSGRKKQSGLTFLKKMENIDEDYKNEEKFYYDSNEYGPNQNYYNSDNYYNNDIYNYKEKYINDNNEKNIEQKKNYVHALSLPSITKKKKMKNEEYKYFNKNQQNIRLNIDKYKYYNYHYINNVNYINIYNDIYNNVSPFSSIDYNGENIFYDNDSNFFKRQPIKNSNTLNINGEINDDFNKNFLCNDKNINVEKTNKEVTPKKMSQVENIYNVTDLFEDRSSIINNSTQMGDNNNNNNNNSDNNNNNNNNNNHSDDNYNNNNHSDDNNNINNNVDIYYNNLHNNSNYYNNIYMKKIQNKTKKSDNKDNNMVPYKIWKIVNQVKNPLIIYSLINHFFSYKNNNKNILKIFNYWSYYIFPSTYKYIFFPLSILQLHPIFKNSDFFILLLHFNLPFILFHLDLFSNKERDKYILLNMLNRRNYKSGHVTTNKGSHDKSENMYSDNEDDDIDDNDNNNNNNYYYYNYYDDYNYGHDPSNNHHSYNYLGRLKYYFHIVHTHTTSINKHQLKTYIMNTNINNQIKKEILKQWYCYKKEKKKEYATQYVVNNKNNLHHNIYIKKKSNYDNHIYKLKHQGDTSKIIHDNQKNINHKKMKSNSKDKYSSTYCNHIKYNNKKKSYHSLSYFPFPILSYKNVHAFYKNFLNFYKFLYYQIFYEQKSYMDVFKCMEYYKRVIYSPLFNDFYYKQDREKKKTRMMNSINMKRYSFNGIIKCEHNIRSNEIQKEKKEKKSKKETSNNNKNNNNKNNKNNNNNNKHNIYQHNINQHNNYNNFGANGNVVKWEFNQDIYHLVNIIICCYNSLTYNFVKMLSIEIIYCIILHVSENKLNNELISFLLYCFNKENEKIKIMVLKCFYKIINNSMNNRPNMQLYLEKFLPKYYLLKNQDIYEKYYYSKYLPLFSYITIQYIYNESLLKNNKTIIKKNKKSQIPYMEILNDIKTEIHFILNTQQNFYENLFEFYNYIFPFCKIMNKKWVNIYILPYLLKNIYKTKNNFIKATCAKVTLRIVFYINQKKVYHIFLQYLNKLLCSQNQQIIQFILCEINHILKKTCKKYQQEQKKSKKFWNFLRKIQIDHLYIHPSIIIQQLVHKIINKLKNIEYKMNKKNNKMIIM